MATSGNGLDSLLTDLNRLKEKSRQNTAALLRIIDSVTDVLEGGAAKVGSQEGAGASQEPAAETPSSQDDAASAISSLRVMTKLADQHKSYHGSISKFTKAVDRAFKEGPPDISRNVTFERRPLDEMVALHLYTEGRYRTAAKLVEEAGLSISLQAYESLAEMHRVIEAMEKKDLSPAYRWVESHREGLKRLGSNLEFQLVRLQYLMLLYQAPAGGFAPALEFAQQHFSDFAAGNMEQVQSLMGCLLYAERLDQSPYSALLSEDLWEKATRTLYVDGCRLLGLPVEGPLSVGYRAGLLGMGPLQKMKTVVESSKGHWDAIHELPAEVEIGNDLRFHSIFSCPVTREQAVRENPPIMLKCGHVICRNSMTRILKGGNRLKCPTCPVEQYADETRELKL